MVTWQSIFRASRTKFTVSHANMCVTQCGPVILRLYSITCFHITVNEFMRSSAHALMQWLISPLLRPFTYVNTARRSPSKLTTKLETSIISYRFINDGRYPPHRRNWILRSSCRTLHPRTSRTLKIHGRASCAVSHQAFLHRATHRRFRPNIRTRYP